MLESQDLKSDRKTGDTVKGHDVITIVSCEIIYLTQLLKIKKSLSFVGKDECRDVCIKVDDVLYT